MNSQTVLVTGGVGYIGSHTVIELVACGYNVVVVDNLINSNKECLKRVEKIIGKTLQFYHINLLNKEDLSTVFSKHKIDCVIHFAALKAVGESVAQPLRYYKNNLISALNLVEVMSEHGVRRLVFSSSATVYGTPSKLPIAETEPTGGCTNPYGWTKLFIEQILTDLCHAEPDWAVCVLRYFNPVGAHESGLIGEDPCGQPANLMPFVAQVAVGRLPCVRVFGDDYDTPDGTGVRDYIHVVDLAKGHISAVTKLSDMPGLKTFNLGTGRGYSVLEMIQAFSRASGTEVKHQICPRRPGDLAEVYADTELARKELGWSAKYDLEKMCQDLWNWQQKNPCGFAGDSV